jgi:hypothetical protein
MSLLNELQNVISAVSVVQTSTLKTEKEFEFRYLHKEFNLFESSGVRAKFRHVTQCFTYHTANFNSEGVFFVAGSFKTKTRSRMKFRVLNALVFFLNIIFKIFFNKILMLNNNTDE